jgi:hypothetical protein
VTEGPPRMRYVLTLTERDIRRPWRLGRHYTPILTVLGHLLPSDVGKRVYEETDQPGVYHVESAVTRDARGPWPENPHPWG